MKLKLRIRIQAAIAQTSLFFLLKKIQRWERRGWTHPIAHGWEALFVAPAAVSLVGGGLALGGPTPLSPGAQALSAALCVSGLFIGLWGPLHCRRRIERGGNRVLRYLFVAAADRLRLELARLELELSAGAGRGKAERKSL